MRFFVMALNSQVTADFVSKAIFANVACLRDKMLPRRVRIETNCCFICATKPTNFHICLFVPLIRITLAFSRRCACPLASDLVDTLSISPFVNLSSLEPPFFLSRPASISYCEFLMRDDRGAVSAFDTAPIFSPRFGCKGNSACSLGSDDHISIICDTQIKLCLQLTLRDLNVFRQFGNLSQA